MFFFNLLIFIVYYLTLLRNSFEHRLYHVNRVKRSGILVGSDEKNTWRGFWSIRLKNKFFFMTKYRARCALWMYIP